MPRLSDTRMRLFVAALAWLTCALIAAPLVADEAKAQADAESTDAAVSFQRDVLPILRARCQGCHQPARSEGGVDLTSRAAMLAESESGLAAITPGDADASELLAQITPDDSGKALMPKEGDPLKRAEIDLFRRWIAAGAEVDASAERPRYDADHPPEYSKPATIAAIDVSPDGSLIAVGGVNETLLLDASAAMRGERTVVRRLIGLASRVESIRFSPDGARLAVTGGLPGEQGELQIWEVATGKLLLSRTATADTLHGVAWTPDGKSLAFGGADTSLHVVSAETGEQQIEQGAHSDWVLDAAFSTDGKFVVSGSRDQSLKLVELASGRLVDNITGVSPGVPSGPIFAISRHPQKDLVAVGGGEGVLRTYMMHRVVERKIGDDSNLVRVYPTMPGRIFAVAFSPDGKQLAAGSSDQGEGHVRVFAVPDAFLPPDDVKLIQAKEVGGRTPEEKARIEAYNREAAELVATAAGEMKAVYALAFHPDGQSVISAGADGVLHIHKAADGAEIARVGVFEIEPAATDSKLAVAAELPPVEFLSDVMPVLGKLGCNAGTCHGSRTGQNGFQLSLRGYDPLIDYRALTDDLAARRINLANPETSLMLLKATGYVPHGGHAVVDPGHRRYDVLRRWIAEGAKYNPEAPRVVSISLSPQNPVLDAEGQTLAMKVLAKYSDGTERDVSADAFIESGDTECATADAAGTITALRRGEAPMLARYEGAYAATTLTVMGDRTGFESTPQPVYNRIDELVDVKLARMKIAASGLCTDEEFVRRLYLDLTGLPPTADQVRTFLADQRDSRAKRADLVDALIGSEDYVEHWTNRWADLLMVNGKFLGSEGAAAYRQWIRTAIAENKPYDQFVRELFTSTGSNRTSPGGSYFKVLRTPDMIAETTTQVFLGVRFNCNKCHDHPFERWTQDNYYGWAAFFADVRLQKDPESGDRTIAGSAVEAAQPLYEIIDDGAAGEMIHLRTGKPVDARFPYVANGTKTAADKQATPLRAQAAQWITARDNPYFASSYVNRVWAHLTGAGVIEPIDDIRAGNPPTNPELLKWLTDEFIASNFDVRQLIRTICLSRTYQLSHQTNRWNEDDRRNYSHALPRRLPAEALYDAVHLVVGSVSKLPGVPPGTRAAALPDSMIEVESGLLSKLGRPARESGCECERTSELQLGPVMALLNGPTFAQAIDDPDSELARLEASTKDNGLLVDEVFLRVLGRAPTAEERQAGVDMLASPTREGDGIAAALAERTAALDAGFEDWRRQNRPVQWQTLAPLEATAEMGAALELQDDGSILSTGATGKGAYVIRAEAPAQPIRGLRIEAIADDRLPARGPGRAPNGNFVLSHLRVFAAPADKPDARRKLKITDAQADVNQPGYEASGAIDAKPETGWAVANGIGQTHVAVFRFARPLTPEEGTRLIVELDQQHKDAQHMLGRFRISVTDEEPPLMRPDHPPQWRALLAARQLSDDERGRLRAHYLSQDAEYRELEQAERMVSNPRLMAVQDLAWALINSPAFLFNH
jgi:WD40 repeat protein